MSVCGYHPYMGEGIRRFAEGLKLALKAKAERHGRNLGEHMSREADEIAILRAFLERRVGEDANGGDQPVSLGFLGIVYICYFLMADPVRLARNPSQLEAEIASNADKIIDFLMRFEDAFEQGPDKTSAFAKTNYAWDQCSGREVLPEKSTAETDNNLGRRIRLA